MFQLYYKGQTWYYGFSEPDGILSHADRELLLWNAIDLYMTKKTRRNIKGEEFEGRLVDTKQSGRCGAFYGRRIGGIIETDKGKGKFEILLRRGNPSRLN